MTALPSQPEIWDLPDEVATGGSAWRPWSADEDDLPGRLGSVARAAGVAAVVVLGLVLRFGIDAAAAGLVSLDDRAEDHAPCVLVVDGSPRPTSLASTLAAAVLRYL